MDTGNSGDASHYHGDRNIVQPGPTDNTQPGSVPATATGQQGEWQNQSAGQITPGGGGADLDNFFNDFPMDLGAEMGGIYSSYNDPTLPLTGIDELDWAEVGKMFQLKEV